MPRKPEDLTGRKFGKLTAIRRCDELPNKYGKWVWLCDCGQEAIAISFHVKSGTTKSCGCLVRNPSGLKIGDKYGLLTLLGNATGTVASRGAWNWLCDCGNQTVLRSAPVLNGNQVSCGCYAKAGLNGRPKHGMHKTKTYASWVRMKARCYGNNSPEHYKNRGIRVCDRWINSFESFYEDMGDRPEGMSLERIDFNADYSPENCRWATQQEQVRNTRRTIFVTVNGEKMCLKDACEIKGIPYARIMSRIHGAGREPQEALDAP